MDTDSGMSVQDCGPPNYWRQDACENTSIALEAMPYQQRCESEGDRGEVSDRENWQSSVKRGSRGPDKVAFRGQPRTRADGDVEVVQVKSVIGTHKKQKNIDRLRSIRLHRIGQSTTGFSDDPVFMGNVFHLKGIVEALPLAKSEHRSQSPRSGEIAVTVDHYAAGQMNGEIQKFANGEYMVTEQQSGNSYALAWSSALPLLTLVGRTTRILNKYGNFTTGVVRFADGKFMDGDAKRIIGRILSAPEDVRFFRLDSDEFSFGWKARVAIHKDYPQIEVNECGFTSYMAFDRGLCTQLIERSATDELGHNVHRSIGHASHFLSDVSDQHDPEKQLHRSPPKQPLRSHGDSVGDDS